jgi:hypothetical protein
VRVATAFSAVVVIGCIDPIELGLTPPAGTRTVVLGMGDSTLFASAAFEPIDLITSRRPQEAVFLKQTLDELQLADGFNPDGARELPDPIGAVAQIGLDGEPSTWRESDPMLRLPEFDPPRCATVGCAAGRRAAEWCDAACVPPEPIAPRPIAFTCDDCDRPRDPFSACPIGQVRFSIEAACEPLVPCSEDFPLDAVLVAPGESVEDAVAAAGDRIVALLPGAHTSDFTGRAHLRGVCPEQTTLSGSIELLDGAIERMALEGSLSMIGTATIAEVEIRGTAELDAFATLRRVSFKSESPRPLSIQGGRTIGERIAFEGEGGFVCRRASIVLSDVFGELRTDAEGTGFELEGCSLELRRAFLRGGHAAGNMSAGSLLMEDVEVRREGIENGFWLVGRTTMRRVRIYDGGLGIKVDGGSFTGEDLALVGCNNGLITGRSRELDIGLERIALLRNKEGGLRMYHRGKLDVRDLLLDELILGIPADRSIRKAMDIEFGVTGTIARARLIGGGAIDVETDHRFRIFDLDVRAPIDRGLWVRGGDMMVQRARIEGANGGQQVGIEVGMRGEATGGAVRIEDLELIGPGEGIGIRVSSGSDLILDRFRIDGFGTAVRWAIDSTTSEVSDGTIRGNGIGVDHVAGDPAPRLFGVRFRENDADFGSSM